MRVEIREVPIIDKVNMTIFLNGRKLKQKAPILALRLAFLSFAGTTLQTINDFA
jgi:hypothetical protein